MSKLTPEEFQEKHARRLKESIPDITRGIERVTESPTMKAAAKEDKMKHNIMEALNSGKWKRGLMRVSLDDWKKAATEKGVPRISIGIDAAAPKVTKFAGELLSFEDNLKTSVDKMPDISFEDSINKMVTWVRGMKKFKRSQ